MTNDQLKYGQLLLENIKTSTEALNNLKELKTSSKSKKHLDNELDDGQYWLSISEHGDGSCKKGKVDLNLESNVGGSGSRHVQYNKIKGKL
mgnify:CR=1 FL=1